MNSPFKQSTSSSYHSNTQCNSIYSTPPIGSGARDLSKLCDKNEKKVTKSYDEKGLSPVRRKLMFADMDRNEELYSRKKILKLR